MATLSSNGYQRLPADRALLEIDQLISEARIRWLKPAEICQILNNHEKLGLSDVPPTKPGSGLLFLFNRNQLRYFRKDGHNWRKKRDGRTVREAHEKLKDGNKDVIHCYYAHGEDNPNFQRRSYWLLEEGRDHIVLVHYREVTEGNYSQAVSPALCSTSRQPDNLIYQEHYEYFSQNLSSSPSDNVSESYNSYEDRKEKMLPRVSDNNTRTGQYIQYAPPSMLPPAKEEFKEYDNTSLTIGTDSGYDLQIRIGNEAPSKVDFREPLYEGTWTPSLEESGSPHNSCYGSVLSGEVSASVGQSSKWDPLSNVSSQQVFKEGTDSLGSKYVRFAENTTDLMHSMQPNGLVVNGKKCDGYDWMEGRLTPTGDIHCTQGTPLGDSKGLFTNTQNTCFSSMPSLPQRELFHIVDFAPEWSYAFEETKVIVTGIYLDDVNNSNRRWSCVFGEIEVPADVLKSGALRCKAPAHAPGDVVFYVTCDGLACSYIQRFHYKVDLSNLSSNSEGDKQEKAVKHQEQELLHQIRLSELLVTRDDEAYGKESSEDTQAIWKSSDTSNSLLVDKRSWKKIEDMVNVNCYPFVNAKSLLIQTLLESKLKQWIRGKDGNDASILNSHGQGVLHMAAALGYQWAVPSILSTGIGVNFRDAHGWTALHWAAFCGREEAIGVLLAADAAPGALTDPTPSNPNGQTAADLAAKSGHDGIAGYLAEASLTSHLTSLALQDHKMSKVLGSMHGNKAVEVFSEKTSVDPNFGSTEADLSLKDSLGAIRNAAQAAARIQAAFRAYSFHIRADKNIPSVVDEFGILEDEAIAFAAAQANQSGYGGNPDKLNLAATQIQCKYRGWKGRREFISLRNQVVKIQAHVRGHQVRKKYRPQLLWGVGILEKAILRWRRKGQGLRGFKAGGSANDDSDDEGFLKSMRRKKEESFVLALSRVKKLMENPDARCQYRRMLEIYQKEKGAQLTDDMIILDDELMSLLGTCQDF